MRRSWVINTSVMLGPKESGSHPIIAFNGKIATRGCSVLGGDVSATGETCTAPMKR
jgi:hypothetical protein